MPIYNGNDAGNTLIGSALSDYISGFAGDDILQGLAGNDTLYGGDGNDTLDGGPGSDRLFGQSGDDRFVMDTSSALDYIDGGSGLDIVDYGISSGSTTVVDFLNGSLNSGAAAGDQLISIEGFRGSDGRDFVSGSNDLNLFYATRGNDQYSGRGGEDVYFAYNPTPASYPVYVSFEVSFGARASTLASLAGIATPAASSAVAYFEIWDDLNSNGTRDAGEVSRHADVLSSIEYFVGTAAGDRMSGSSANETFSPLTGTNTVNGGGGIDVLSYNFLEASGYADGLRGATVDLAAGTAITSHFGPNTSGIYAYRQSTSTIVSIENINGSRFQDQLQGNGLANVIAGLDGDDALDGRGGNDEIYGGRGMDIVVGGDGNDIISGGAGADTLDGGSGADILTYASASTSIAVSLLRGSGLIPIINNVSIFGSVSEGDSILNVENVIGSTFADVIIGNDGNNILEGRSGQDLLEGCGGDDIIYGERDPLSPIPDFIHEHDLTNPDAVDDCDCDQDGGHHDSEEFNDTIVGGDGADRLYGQLGEDDICGGTGADSLYGAEGNDVLDGESGNDLLDGGIGTDFLYGGDGNDRISGGAGFDIIFGDRGTDTVDYSGSLGAVTVNLEEYWRNSGGDASVDYLSEIMTNLANGEDPTLIVQSALFLSLITSLGGDGSDGAFTLGIPDVIIGVESIIGSNFADDLTGNSLANHLNGSLGADRMTGLGGNDTYYIDNVGDVIVEAVGGGTDAVRSSLSHSLGSNVENLTLTGTFSINGFGNALANVLNGNGSANTLNGRGGADTMSGGNGNDTYIVDALGDVVIETSATGGVDTVVSGVSFALGANLENLTLNGSAVTNGTGNGLANSLTGNGSSNRLSGLGGNDSLNGGAGNDTLVGGTGNDALNGGTGNDFMRFDTALSATTNVDLIVNFSVANDTIQLDNDVFTAAGAIGTLSAEAFRAGTAAADASDRIIYDSATGRIYYDADGNGAGAQILFAQLSPGLALTNADFAIIG